MARWGYCPSGRFFEAAACGTPIVTDWFDGLNAFYNCDHELIVVNSSDQVISAIELPDSELSQIAQRARERTLDRHTGEQRACELIAAIEGSRASAQSQKARSEVA